MGQRDFASAEQWYRKSLAMEKQGISPAWPAALTSWEALP